MYSLELPENVKIVILPPGYFFTFGPRDNKFHELLNGEAKYMFSPFKYLANPKDYCWRNIDECPYSLSCGRNLHMLEYYAPQKHILEKTLKDIFEKSPGNQIFLITHEEEIFTFKHGRETIYSIIAGFVSR